VPLINLAILPSNASKIAANKINVTAKVKLPSIENLIELIPRQTPARVKMFGSKYLVFFEGIPSPAGGLLILMPLIYELTDLNIKFDIKELTPYLTIFISILLVSKIPTLALKKISISPKATVFLLLGIGVVFIALLFYTFETLLIFGISYLISIPVSMTIYNNQNKKIDKITDDNDEDIL